MKNTYPSYSELRDDIAEHFSSIGHAASHWSQLYEGGSKLIILVDEQHEIDSINELGLKGTFCSVRMRNGEAHWEDKGYLAHASDTTIEELKDLFYEQHTKHDSNNWLFNTKEEFDDFFNDENGNIIDHSGMFDGEGLYDAYGKAIICRGSLMYSEDVYTYALAFVLDQDDMIDDESDEKEFRIFAKGSPVKMDDVRKGKL